MNIISIPFMHLNVQMKKDISNNCDEQFSIDVHHLIPFALHFMQNGFAICYSAKVKLHLQIDLDLVLLHPLHFVEKRCKDDGREKTILKNLFSSENMSSSGDTVRLLACDVSFTQNSTLDQRMIAFRSPLPRFVSILTAGRFVL